MLSYKTFRKPVEMLAVTESEQKPATAIEKLLSESGFLIFSEDGCD